jgi:hypothetical protein
MTTDVVTGFFVDQSIGLADRRSRVMNDFRHVSDLHSAFFDIFKSILVTAKHLNFVSFGLRVKTDARHSRIVADVRQWCWVRRAATIFGGGAGRTDSNPNSNLRVAV